MIRSTQRFFVLLDFLSDCLLVFCAFVLAYLLRFSFQDGELSGLTVQVYWALALLAVPFQGFAFLCLGLYGARRKERLRFVALRLIYGNVLGCGALTVFLFLLKLVHFSRLALVYFFLIETVFLIGKRFLFLRLFFFFRGRGYYQKEVIICGAGALAKAYVAEIQDRSSLGYLLRGYLSEERAEDFSLEFLGKLEDLEEVLEYFHPDELVVALSLEEFSYVDAIIGLCEKTGTKLAIIPFYALSFPGKPQVDFLNELPMLHVRPIPLEHFAWAFVKRCVDFFGGIVLLLVFSPVLLGIAVGVICSSKGPVIFKQTRVGLNKKNFQMYKFRSMVVNGESDSAWSQKEDSRKTKFGAFLRKFSLDELPQLWNVVKGDMSLVGPRPEIPHFVEHFKVDIPHYMVKHHVRPGMTGLAQIKGFRGNTSIEGRIAQDIYYIEHWSLWMDFKILLITVVKGFMNEEKLVLKEKK